MTTRQLSVLGLVAALLAVLLFASCSTPEETPTPGSSGFGERGVFYFGLTSMEELVVNAKAIARVRFVSAEQTIEVVQFSYLKDGTDSYAGAVVVTFDVLEYLKGSGGDRIKAVLYDGDFVPFDKARVTAEDEDFLEFRDKRWDDREAIVFLNSGEFIPSTLTDSDRYYMTYLRANGEFGYTVDSKWAKSWLPGAAAPSSNRQASGASGASGDSQRFITNIEDGASGSGVRGQSGSRTETMTLAEIKAFIKKLQDEVAAGDGTAAYLECVQEKYRWARHYVDSKENEIGLGRSWTETFTKQIDSGVAAGEKVHTGGQTLRLDLNGDITSGAPKSYFRDWVVKTGRDADLFVHTWPLDATTARPLPGGTYRFYWAEQHQSAAPCNAMPEDHKTRFEVVVTVTAPEGTVHETMFDPVALGSGVGADGTNGVLEPSSFSVDGTSTSITSLKWDNGSVVLTLSPHVSLSSHKLDFIELDGSVNLVLEVSSATEDSSAGTLSWTLLDQPWHDGDTLMLRIAASTTPEPTPVPTAEPTPEPTAEPTPEPTAEPTPVPTAEPTPVPTAEPTPEPTAEPTPEPTAEPTPLDRPTQLSGITTGASGATLDWADVTGATSYRIRVRLPSGWVTIPHGSIRASFNGSSATITGLETWPRSFDFKVKAVNSETQSRWSATLTVIRGAPK